MPCSRSLFTFQRFEEWREFQGRDSISLSLSLSYQKQQIYIYIYLYICIRACTSVSRSEETERRVLPPDITPPPTFWMLKSMTAETLNFSADCYDSAFELHVMWLRFYRFLSMPQILFWVVWGASETVRSYSVQFFRREVLNERFAVWKNRQKTNVNKLGWIAFKTLFELHLLAWLSFWLFNLCLLIFVPWPFGSSSQDSICKIDNSWDVESERKILRHCIQKPYLNSTRCHFWPSLVVWFMYIWICTMALWIKFWVVKCFPFSTHPSLFLTPNGGWER